MKRKNQNKLSLNKETIRELSDSKVEHAAGAGFSRFSCAASNCTIDCTDTVVNC